MKNSFLLIVALFLGFYCNAQDLIIEYDYITKSTEYFKVNKKGDTVRLKAPIVRQDQDVQVKVVNFNEHALYVETEVSNENLVESSNPFGLLNMLSPLFNVASKGVLTNMFDERGVDISSIEDEFGFTKAGAQSDYQLKSAQEDFMDLNQKIYDLAKLEESIKTIEFGLNQLYLLSRNSDFKPEQIKEQARQIVSSTLKNGDQPELTSFYYKREDILRESREQIAAAKIISKDIKVYEQFDNKDNFGFASEENAKIYQQMTMETEQLLAAVEKFEASYSRTEVEQMLQLMQSLYFSIQNSKFEYNTNALAEGDRTNINVYFYDVPPIKTLGNDEEVDTEEEEYEEEEDEEDEWEDDWELDFGYSVAAQQNQYAPKRTKTFKVKVSGGLKISPSIGVAFPSYFGAAKDYYARGDSTIVEVDGDNFVPNIAAFVNFYPYTGKAVNFGGSFGVGIPIKGATISPSFLLGGSLILGNKYRIAISGGMATGPVTRLENGFEVGQELLEFQDLETKTKYAIGFYSAISFTIGIGG